MATTTFREAMANLTSIFDTARKANLVPDITDEAVLMRQYQRKRQLDALQGRNATFLTGPRGLGGPPSEIGTAFLRAALEPPVPWPATINPGAHPTRPAPAPASTEVIDPMAFVGTSV